MPKVIQNCFAKCGFSAASSAEVDDKDKNCTWVEQQDDADCTSTFTSFVILTNLSQPQAVSQLVCSPSPQLCACDRRGRGEDGGNTATSHSILSQRCSNGVTSAGFGRVKQMTKLCRLQMNSSIVSQAYKTVCNMAN